MAGCLRNSATKAMFTLGAPSTKCLGTGTKWCCVQTLCSQDINTHFSAWVQGLDFVLGPCSHLMPEQDYRWALNVNTPSSDNRARAPSVNVAWERGDCRRDLAGDYVSVNSNCGHPPLPPSGADHLTPVPLSIGGHLTRDGPPAFDHRQNVGQGLKIREFRNLRLCSLASMLLKQLHRRAVVLERVIPMKVYLRHLNATEECESNEFATVTASFHWRCRAGPTGHLTVISARTAGHLTQTFPKSRMPGGLPGEFAKVLEIQRHTLSN